MVVAHDRCFRRRHGRRRVADVVLFARVDRFDVAAGGADVAIDLTKVQPPAADLVGVTIDNRGGFGRGVRHNCSRRLHVAGTTAVPGATVTPTSTAPTVAIVAPSCSRRARHAS